MDPIQLRKLRTAAYFGRVWTSGLARRLRLRPSQDRMLRPRITGEVPPLSHEDVRRFIRETGGDPAWYRSPVGDLFVPQTYFATWALPELARALLAARLPLNFTRVFQAACSIRTWRLPTVTERMGFTATVETVVRTSRRVRVEEHLTTRTPDGLLLGEVVVVLVLPDGALGAGKDRQQEPAPGDATQVGEFELTGDEGWRYARLSGDLNPIHWAGPVARLAGLKGPIAHGFDLMSRAAHLLVAQLASRDPQRLERFEMVFRRPVYLPARVRCLTRPLPSHDPPARQHGDLWLVSEPSQTPCATGQYEVAS